MVFLINIDDGLPGNFLEINRVCTTKLGYNPTELLKMSPLNIIAPDKISEMLNNVNLIKSGGTYVETVYLSKDGKRIPVEASHRIFQLNGKKVAIAISRDITSRKQAEDLIKKSLEEKEMLLKEIHHRVKNNLMIISSLLNLQSQYIKDKASQDIFIESQNRARSMALIHETLYQSTDLKSIDIRDYIYTLSNELFHTYTAGSGRIVLKINVDELFLDINIAIPLGLIINELVTNSLKYAFPEGRSGEIKIDLHPQNDDYEFTVKDTGVGFPDDLDLHNSSSLGLELVKSLTDQIDGEIELDKTEGTTFKITFAGENIH